MYAHSLLCIVYVHVFAYKHTATTYAVHAHVKWVSCYHGLLGQLVTYNMHRPRKTTTVYMVHYQNRLFSRQCFVLRTLLFSHDDMLASENAYPQLTVPEALLFI